MQTCESFMCYCALLCSTNTRKHFLPNVPGVRESTPSNCWHLLNPHANWHRKNLLAIMARGDMQLETLCPMPHLQGLFKSVVWVSYAVPEPTYSLQVVHYNQLYSYFSITEIFHYILLQYFNISVLQILYIIFQYYCKYCITLSVWRSLETPAPLAQGKIRFSMVTRFS